MFFFQLDILPEELLQRECQSLYNITSLLFRSNFTILFVLPLCRTFEFLLGNVLLINEIFKNTAQRNIVELHT